MIDDSCEVPREDLDDGFNPCRKQVVENGELEAYAHMYDVMNERYDREEDTSHLNSVKRDRITHSTPSQTVGEGKLYAQDAQGVEGFVKSSETLDPTTHAEIPSSKAVADYAPIPLPISKGGTGGNTPYVADDLDASAIFVMHDAPNDRYDAVPMSALRNYLTTQFMSFYNESIPEGADLNTYKEPGNYSVRLTETVPTIVNKPDDTSMAFNLYVVPILSSSYTAQYLVEYGTASTYYRYYMTFNSTWTSWKLLYPASSAVPNPLPVDQGGTGAQTAQGALANLLPRTTSGASATGALVYDVDSGSTYLRAISGESSGYQTDLVNRGGIQAIIDAHSLNTPPSPFSYKVAPYPSGTWEGEMTVNVVPVFSVTIGATEYIMARVYGAKKFNYPGTADNISLFSSIQIVEEYPYTFKNGTSIPLELSIQGRSYAAGTYGFNPRGSSSDVLLNNQMVPSVLFSANLNMSNSLNCVFGTGTNTPGVTVSFSCLTLMWRNLS